MNAKIILPTALLAASNIAAANGGLAIDTVAKHMNAGNWTNTQANQQEIIVQAPLDQFRNYIADEITVVDVNKFKQNYDGQS